MKGEYSMDCSSKDKMFNCNFCPFLKILWALSGVWNGVVAGIISRGSGFFFSKISLQMGNEHCLKWRG